MSAREIVAALRGRWTGKSGAARCPAHRDKSPSLSVTDGDSGRVLVHCFGGCSQVAVLDALRALGLWPDRGDAAPRPRPSPPPLRSIAEFEADDFADLGPMFGARPRGRP